MVRRRAVLLFSLLAIAHGSIAPVLPSPSHDLMAYLKGRPTDRSEIKQRLKAALSTGNREDAYVIGRYLRRYLGVRHARLDVLLGELAHDLGRLPEARAWALEALKADPAAPKARALLARTESPSTDRPSGVSATASTTTSTGAAWVASEPARDRGFREALRAFHEDRFDKALGAVGRVLERSPGDLEALTLKYRIHLARMETDAASRILADLARTHPGDPRVHVRLGEAARQRWSRDRSPATLQSALEHFATALALDPDNGPALLSLAALHYSLDRRTVADGLYRRATAQRPFADREMVLNDAFILFSRGDEARSLEVLEHYSRTFGSDSGSLLTEGLVRLRMGQKDDAAECLESALRRNPQNLSAVLTIVPVLVTMDQAARALRVISAAEAEYPESAHVSTLSHLRRLRAGPAAAGRAVRGELRRGEDPRHPGHRPRPPGVLQRRDRLDHHRGPVVLRP
ncbi:MAG: tetratricopeptide repeat protein [Candidatus Riflebacteria bacterium]|nr:tetratricopeptide repeat protein [Candidatus Riflebacteria bacterium]